MAVQPEPGPWMQAASASRLLAALVGCGMAAAAQAGQDPAQPAPRPLDARLLQAAQAGDALATEIFAQAGTIIGLSIVSILHLFNPAVVVLGGGVSKAGDLLFAPMRAAVRQHVLDDAYMQDFSIVAAALGDDVALVGAAALVATDGGQLDISELDRLF